MDLQLPQRFNPGRTSFNTSTEAIRNWIDELPLLNTARTSELASGALEQINALEIPAGERFTALELFTIPVMCAADGLKKTFIGKPVPLHGNELKHATQAIGLYNGMATGYRILADDLGSDDGQRQQLATAIHRALRYLSEILLTNYQIYVQYPDGLWSIIHALYALGEKFGLAGETITDTTLHTPDNSSIDRIYKQVLLLSLACPYRLRQNETLYVYNALLDWAESSHLFHASADGARGLFAVNLAEDRPPAYRALQDSQQDNRQLRILDTTKMEQQMQLAAARESNSSDRPAGLGGSSTMQRLLLTWGVMPKRRFSRHREDSQIELVIGLNAIHQLSAVPVPEKQHNNGISEAIHNHQYLQDPTFEAPTTVKTDFDITQDRRSNPAAGHGKVSPLKGAYLASPPTEGHHETWTVTDISAGGYCLLHEAEAASRVRVGELVAIPSGKTAQPDTIQLGVIRWLRFTRERGLELGLQLLSPGTQAVWVSVREDELNSPEKLQGILLPEIKPLRQPATLLLPSLPFRTGCLCTLEYSDRKEAITLTRQLENTGCFAQYDFSLADQ
jgi:hypothetical protein